MSYVINIKSNFECFLNLQIIFFEMAILSSQTNPSENVILYPNIPFISNS